MILKRGVSYLPSSALNGKIRNKASEASHILLHKYSGVNVKSLICVSLALIQPRPFNEVFNFKDVNVTFSWETFLTIILQWSSETIYLNTKDSHWAICSRNWLLQHFQVSSGIHFQQGQEPLWEMDPRGNFTHKGSCLLTDVLVFQIKYCVFTPFSAYFWDSQEQFLSSDALLWEKGE